MSLMPATTSLTRLRRFLRSGVTTVYSMIWLCGGLMVFCLLAVYVVKLHHKYEIERAETQFWARQLSQAQAEHDRLAGRYQYLKSPEGKMATAIEHGWVKPGDKAVNFPPQPPTVVATPVSPTAENTTLGGLILAALALFILAFFTGIALLISRWRALRPKLPPGSIPPRPRSQPHSSMG